MDSKNPLLQDLNALIADLQSLATHAEETMSARAGEPQAQASHGGSLIDGVRRRIADFEAELRRYDCAVRENAWTTMAISATTAFLFGFALAFGRPRRNRVGRAGGPGGANTH